MEMNFIVESNMDMFARKLAYESIMENAYKSKTGKIFAVIPVELLVVDPLYQRINGRNERKLRKLINEWDDNLMDPITVIPHPEIFAFSIGDGLGRVTAGRLKKEPKDKYDSSIVIGPVDIEERRKFEADIFLRQANCTDPIKPAAKHNALMLNNDKVAMIIDRLCKEYQVDIGVAKAGNHTPHVLGSYSNTTGLVKSYGEENLRWVFDVIKVAGFDEENNGYATSIMKSLGAIHHAYPNVSYNSIGEYMRHMNPVTFKSRAIAAYPERSASDGRIAMILFLQDYINENIDSEVKFDSKGKMIKAA